MAHTDLLLRDGDSAFLGELLALLDGADDDARVADAAPVKDENPPCKAASRGAKEPTGRKRDIALLHAEVQQLTDQLARLRDAHALAANSAHAKEAALTERRKRQRAESECVALREAVLRQKLFLRGVRPLFSATQRFSLGLDLCRYLHRHTRLSRSRVDRWGKFDSRSQDARIESAIDMLCRETAAVSLSDDPSFCVTPSTTPFVHCELVDGGASRSTTSTAVYALDTQDIGAIVRAVCVAIRDVVTICPTGHPLHVARDVVDANTPADHNMLYRVMRVGHQCASTGEEIQVASHMVTSYKITNNYGVVLWDYVDDDELHPATDTINVTRETTGACLVRRERCDDGVERVVFRSLGTKKFRFHDEQSVEKHRRIACIVQADAMVRGDELLFRRLVLDQIAAEQAIAANVAHV